MVGGMWTYIYTQLANDQALPVFADAWSQFGKQLVLNTFILPGGWQLLKPRVLNSGCGGVNKMLVF